MNSIKEGAITTKQTFFLVGRFLLFALLLYILAELAVSCYVAVKVAVGVLVEGYIKVGLKMLQLTTGQELLETYYIRRTTELQSELNSSITVYVIKIFVLFFALGTSAFLTYEKINKYKRENSQLAEPT